MDNDELLKCYVDLLPFLSSVLGPKTELVVHDIKNPNHSIIAIENPISNRQIGDPLTNISDQLILKNEKKNNHFIANYDGRSKNGNFLSSTYFIYNRGKIIGLLCVNKEISDIQDLRNSMEKVLNHFNLNKNENSEFSEDLNRPIDNIMRERIATTIKLEGVPVERLTVDERISIVQSLKDNGVLSMKNAVNETANQLQVSVPTIYRYMNKNEEE